MYQKYSLEDIVLRKTQQKMRQVVPLVLLLIFPPYLVKCFFLKNQGFFIVYSQMNEPRKWIFLSIWYKNSGIWVYKVKRLCFSFYMALCMPFPLGRRTSRVYQDHLTFPEGPNFLRSAYP